VLALALFACAGLRAEDTGGKSPVSRETLIRITTEKQGASTTHFYVENLQAAEVTVTFEMDLVNLSGSVGLPHTATIPGKTKTKVFTLSAIDPGRGWSWTYTYYSTFGSMGVEHDDTCVYALPYAPGKAYRVSQGFNGEYSHFGSDQFAIDWRMPLGTPVCAARGGTVVGVKDDSNVGGDDSKYDWDANYVLIRHSDGTLGQYVHLLQGGTKLKVGQQVQIGEILGLSGNTGHSTGPHLHFSVFKARDGKHRQTIPVRFQTVDGFGVTLVQGRTYRATGVATDRALLAGSNTAQRPRTEDVAAVHGKDLEHVGSHGNGVGR
jgi:murein DD-endopeptidase MepM/ murein hydrolase activator NlpD